MKISTLYKPVACLLVGGASSLSLLGCASGVISLSTNSVITCTGLGLTYTGLRAVTLGLSLPESRLIRINDEIENPIIEGQVPLMINNQNVRNMLQRNRNRHEVLVFGLVLTLSGAAMAITSIIHSIQHPLPH